MPKNLLKKYMPDHSTVRNHKHMKIFGTLLHDPNIWHMNRRSVSGAFAAGLFWAMIPMPLQMVAAAASAIVFRVNLPIAVALVWLTNPLTMPPIFYAEYLLGTKFLSKHEQMADFEFTTQWLAENLHLIWQPLYLGGLLTGVVFAIIGFVGIRLIWRLHLVSKIQNRKSRKANIPK